MLIPIELMDDITINDMNKLLEFADENGVIMYRLKPIGTHCWSCIFNSNIKDELHRFDHMAEEQICVTKCVNGILYSLNTTNYFDEEDYVPDETPEYFQKSIFLYDGFDPYVTFNKYKHHPNYNVKHAILHTSKIYDVDNHLIDNIHS